MDRSNDVSSNLRKLIIIQQFRLSSMEKELEQAQQKYKQACATLDERLSNILSIHNRIENLHGYLVLERVCSSSEKLIRGDSYMFWLKYDLEMHEYYQSQEQERVEDAKNKYLSTKHDWYKQKLKTEKLNELHNNQSNLERAHVEDLEDECVYENGLNKSAKANG